MFVDYLNCLPHNSLMKTKQNILMPVVLVLLVGCVTYSPQPSARNSVAGVASDKDVEEAELLKSNMTQDVRMLGLFSKELRSISSGFAEIMTETKGKSSDEVLETQSDEIESLLFRYLICRRSLFEISERYSGRNLSVLVVPELHTKGALLGILARQLVRYNDTRLSDAFMNNEVVRTKLNAAYPVAEIPAGSFDHILDSVLTFSNREIQEASQKLFLKELNNPYSMLSQQAAVDAECGVLVRAIRSLYTRQAQSSRSLLNKKVAEDSRYPVRTSSVKVASLVARTENTSATSLDAAVSLDSRGLAQVIAAVVSPPLSLTASQHKQLQSLVRPGDIILTYRKGYLTNLVFPGKFIHGLIYVGDTRDRVPAPDGSRLDLIEATGGGVIMNSLDFITGRHISRLAVLRPRLSATERQDVLDKLFGYMGRDYDMAFDFLDDKKLCCTEIPYHLFDGMGEIKFRLVKRVGLKTLTADDMVKTALRPSGGIDVICVLDEKGGRGRKAILLKGDIAAAHLRKMLGVDGGEL